MRNLLIVGVFLVGAYVAYTRFGGGNPDGPTAAYGEFLQALRSTRFADAAEMIHGEQAEEDLRAFKQRDAALNRRFGGLNIRKLEVEEIDREQNGDTVNLTVQEELRFDPPGASSAYGSANAWLIHEVEMVKVDGTWKVAAFGFEIERVEGLDGIPTGEASMWF